MFDFVFGDWFPDGHKMEGDSVAFSDRRPDGGFGRLCLCTPCRLGVYVDGTGDWTMYDWNQQSDERPDRSRRWRSIMCNRSMVRFLQKYGAVVRFPFACRSLGYLFAQHKESREEDGTALYSIHSSGVYYVRGSYTVEAAVIVPMVIFVLLFIIYSAFYMHNQAVLNTAAYETAVYGSTLNPAEEKIREKMSGKYMDAIKGRLIAMKSPDVNVQVDDSRVTVKIRGEMQTISVGWLPTYDGERIEVEKTVEYQNPVHKLRLWNTIKGLRQGDLYGTTDGI